MCKQLINEITGRTLDIAFTGDTTDIKIASWVIQNLDSLENLGVEFNELHSCGVEDLDETERTIEINGDEDMIFLRIKNLTLIKIG